VCVTAAATAKRLGRAREGNGGSGDCGGVGRRYKDLRGRTRPLTWGARGGGWLNDPQAQEGRGGGGHNKPDSGVHSAAAAVSITPLC